HPNDRQRIARALEVQRATGRPMSWWREREHQTPDYVFCLLGMSMEQIELHRRIEARVEAMLDAGAVDEARRARRQCDDPEAPGWTGIGCAELMAYLRGESSLEDATSRWIRNTKAYAKRQMTWFRKEPGLRWLPALDLEAAWRGAEDALGGDGGAGLDGVKA
ncbi:MAG: tRNA (adenosine(37)-N6)-dimethylallyltransferase, partial [Desulfovibrionaceae bacterium]